MADTTQPESTPSADHRLKGQVAIVTGASSGIGLAVARALAAEGAATVLAARRIDRLEAEARTLNESGHSAMAVRMDVTDMDDVRTGVEAATSAFGGVDILVNNAGIMVPSPLSEPQVEDWTRMVEVNVNGVLRGIAAVIPRMIERGGGHIVNVGSLAGRRPFPGGSVYAATKFAVRALTWGMHLDLGPDHGIRATDIQPGFVETEILDAMPDESRNEWLSQWEGRRTLTVDDIARAVLFAVTSPPHIAVSEVLVRPLDQPA